MAPERARGLPAGDGGSEGMKRSAVIFDRDGTLASCQGHLVEQDPPDWGEFNAWIPLDAVVPETAALFHLLREFTDLALIITTGRMDDQRRPMLDWLEKHGLYPDRLIMRHHKDRRVDSVVKLEMYREQIEPLYEVRLVVDDRPQVVAMWRELGLPVLAVTDPTITPPILNALTSPSGPVS